jgi:hypothetical protein
MPLEIVEKIKRNLNLLRKFQIELPREYKKRAECFWKGYSITYTAWYIVSKIQENKWDEAIDEAERLLDYVPYGCGTDPEVSKIERIILYVIDAVKTRNKHEAYEAIDALFDTIEDFYVSLGGLVPRI